MAGASGESIPEDLRESLGSFGLVLMDVVAVSCCTAEDPDMLIQWRLDILPNRYVLGSQVGTWYLGVLVLTFPQSNTLKPRLPSTSQ